VFVVARTHFESTVTRSRTLKQLGTGIIDLKANTRGYIDQPGTTATVVGHRPCGFTKSGRVDVITGKNVLAIGIAGIANIQQRLP
jgi:hypothetical protein